MKYCKKCLQPDTRPGIQFDAQQVCGACRYQEEMEQIDWPARERELRDIAATAKKKAQEWHVSYDCVIGVSGGKDSTFQACYARDKLGLHPLLVNCAPDEMTDVGRHNIDNLYHLGFDIVSIHPNPDVCKQLARKTFLEKGNIVVASEYCLWASAYIMADKFNIPLIIQGENAALTLGTSKIQETTGDAYSVLQLDTLHGAQIKELLQGEDNLSLDDVFFYRFPDVTAMRQRGIQAVFLQYYAKEWSQNANADFSIARGLWGRTTENLHDIGGYKRYVALDEDLVIANQMIKYLKFGFGAATDQVCYDIREGKLSREDGKWYVNEYDGRCGEQYIDSACQYMGISKQQFWSVVDRFVNTKLFAKVNGKWQPKFTVGEDFAEN